ncbi:MAG: transcription termination factor NusA [Puniceicoccales bacterium]|jgi:N utilization substance protein A|nr:transcription termination factor NusA [Puniceicoccales bacterium]
MSNEILSVLEYMEKEKGISRADMIETIVAAIKNAAAKGINAGQELNIKIDPRTGKLEASTPLTVVDSVSDPAKEIHIKSAALYAKNPKIGDVIEKPSNASELGRIAAQTARQAIMQRVRQFEKERIFDEFKDQIGNIVTGVVRRRERGDVIVELGKAEATLPSRERSPGEDFAAGDRIRCLLLDIETTPRGPEIILSRSHPNFVKRMLELEVAEIADGTVFIAALAREAGYRTKIAVDTRDPKVDPVGACVGARGARVRNIVKELGGEKVDIIRWYVDPIQMLQEAIKPAVARNVHLEEGERRIRFEVAEEDLSIAIGRKGQNAKLTSRILGWRLDIKKEERHDSTFETKMEKAVSGLLNIPGISPELAQRLVEKGFVSMETFAEVSAEDLVEEGFEPAEAAMVIDIVTSNGGKTA